VEHISGPQPLEIGFRPVGATIAEINNAAKIGIREAPTTADGMVTVMLPVGETIVVNAGSASM
jgi:hypothetical protein